MHIEAQRIEDQQGEFERVLAAMEAEGYWCAGYEPILRVSRTKGDTHPFMDQVQTEADITKRYQQDPTITELQLVEKFDEAHQVEGVYVFVKKTH